MNSEDEQYPIHEYMDYGEDEEFLIILRMLIDANQTPLS